MTYFSIRKTLLPPLPPLPPFMNLVFNYTYKGSKENMHVE